MVLETNFSVPPRPQLNNCAISDEENKTLFVQMDNSSTNTMLLLEPTLSSDFLSLEEQFGVEQDQVTQPHPGKDDLRQLEVGVTAFPKASRGVPPVVSRLVDDGHAVDETGLQHSKTEGVNCTVLENKQRWRG